MLCQLRVQSCSLGFLKIIAAFTLILNPQVIKVSITHRFLPPVPHVKSTLTHIVITNQISDRNKVLAITELTYTNFFFHEKQYFITQIIKTWFPVHYFVNLFCLGINKHCRHFRNSTYVCCKVLLTRRKINTNIQRSVFCILIRFRSWPVIMIST